MQFLIVAALPTAVQAQEHSITITAAPELFLSHADMNCPGVGRGSGRDSTDIPVTAFRRKDGSVVVLTGNQNNYVLEGPSVDKAKRSSCTKVVAPLNDSDPRKFTGRRWLFAIHASNYEFALGFIHNEYHGTDFFPDQCIKSSQRNFECWYGSTTLVVSRDGGFTFQTPESPTNVLAAPPQQFQVGSKRRGATSPKVVVNPNDGLTYVLVDYFDVDRDLRGSECLLRGSGKELNDWRAWNGKGFTLNMGSPYAVHREGDCTPVVPYVVSSVKFIPALQQFVCIGLRGTSVLYAFSKDLITWTQPKPLMEIQRFQNWRPGDPPARAYFSLLDPSSSSINFDTLETKPYLFFVQFDVNDRRRTDVYRVPLAIN